ncbi:hypothetical protein BDP27DRAFT_308012 [Rhodocollybia butyracea]|uniref:Uncharacterized protein n=1 Tax=Rhodocollybia butyracea TaxID=206335 RepID=A0A9P5TZW9_9AGAR|nr:hypothetical protein BDP27DRAFT_308012 [Rhodocollybia butyracea]
MMKLEGMEASGGIRLSTSLIPCVFHRRYLEATSLIQVIGLQGTSIFPSLCALFFTRVSFFHTRKCLLLSEFCGDIVVLQVIIIDVIRLSMLSYRGSTSHCPFYLCEPSPHMNALNPAILSAPSPLGPVIIPCYEERPFQVTPSRCLHPLFVAPLSPATNIVAHLLCVRYAFISPLFITACCQW